MILNSSRTIQYETSGVIKTTNQNTDLAYIIKIILLGLEEVINQFKPDCVAIEKVFVNTDPQSTLLLGQARGAAISAAVLRNLDVYEYTALQVKKSVVGKGHASKSQVQIMVQKLLSLPSIPSSDSADALACSICHANISGSLAKFGTGNRMKAGRII